MRESTLTKIRKKKNYLLRFTTGCLFIMKGLFFMTLLLYSSVLCAQQAFAPSGAVWYYDYQSTMSAGYIKLEAIGDTIIDGKVCRIIHKTQFVYTFPGIFDTTKLQKEFIYFDNNKAQYYRKSKFYTLYDFSATIGASWTVVGRPLHNPPDTGVVYVDSVSTEVINGDTLRVLFLRHSPGSIVGWLNAKVIERIGNVNEYFFPEYVSIIVDANEGGPLRCYSDSSFALFSTGIQYSCDYINNLPKMPVFDCLMLLYPNPTTDYLTLQTKNNTSLPQGTLQIFNMQGALQMELAIPKHQSQLQLNLSHLPAGLYLGRIVGSSGEGGGFRFVKE